jgi:Flp pilus assembly protein TadD
VALARRPEPPRERRPAAPAAYPPTQVTRTPKVDPVFTRLQRSYRAFQNGDLDAAERGYRRLLVEEPNNRDALLGLGAVATSQGRAAEAYQAYVRVLALNPRDRVAHAALAGIQGEMDPVRSRSQLQMLLHEDPGAPYVHFALGNLHAAQSRWDKAQQAYFNAYQGDTENADYAFNLAVSLDHLGQGRAALQYYRRALALSGRRLPSFSVAEVRRRIEALEAGGSLSAG